MAEKTNKAKKIKCTKCGKSFDSNLITVKGTSKYCPDCLEIQVQENEDWSVLYEYCKEIFHVEQPSVRVITQLQKFRKDEERHMTTLGMYYTLKYCNEVLNKEFDIDEGVGIIPWYYDSAKNYYNQVFDIEDAVENIEFKREIKIIKTKLNKSPKKLKKELPIDAWRGETEDD